MPCCNPTVNPTVDPFPSTRNHLEMVQSVREDTHPLGFTAQQRQILQHMRGLVQSAPLENGMLPLSAFEDFARCLDTLGFRSKLFSRIRIVLTAPGLLVKPKNVWGITSFWEGCVQHPNLGGQVHGARITLDPMRKKKETDLQYRTRMFSHLTHEECHAYVCIFMDRSTFTVRDCLLVVGSEGHGTAWVAVFDWLIWVLRLEDVLVTDKKRTLDRSVRNDQILRRRIFQTLKQMRETGLTSKQREELLAEKLMVSGDQAGRFVGFRQEGHTMLEAVVMTVGGWRGFWAFGS